VSKEFFLNIYRKKWKGCQRLFEKKGSIAYVRVCFLSMDRRDIRLRDYHPPPQARTGNTWTNTVAAMMNSSTAIFFI
jgi:hypothetical protein